MAEDREYEVVINCKITETTSNGSQPMFDGNIEYHKVPYDGVVAIEGILLKMQQDLKGLGDQAVKEKTNKGKAKGRNK